MKFDCLKKILLASPVKELDRFGLDLFLLLVTCHIFYANLNDNKAETFSWGDVVLLVASLSLSLPSSPLSFSRHHCLGDICFYVLKASFALYPNLQSQCWYKVNTLFIHARILINLCQEMSFIGVCCKSLSNKIWF